MLFKSSLWFDIDYSVVVVNGGFHFSKYYKNMLFFPTNDGVGSIKLIPDVYNCALIPS